MKRERDVCDANSLCKADEVFVVGVHVGVLDLDEERQLILRAHFLFANAHVHNALNLFAQHRVAIHLNSNAVIQFNALKKDNSLNLDCRRSGNLFSAFPDDVGEFGDDHVDALERRLEQLLNLFLDDRFEGEVRREETRANTQDVLDGVHNLASQLLLVELHLVARNEINK